MSAHEIICPQCAAASRYTHAVVPTISPGKSCPECGWPKKGANDDRIAMALERIADALETLAVPMALDIAMDEGVIGRAALAAVRSGHPGRGPRSA